MIILYRVVFLGIDQLISCLSSLSVRMLSRLVCQHCRLVFAGADKNPVQNNPTVNSVSFQLKEPIPTDFFAEP